MHETKSVYLFHTIIEFRINIRFFVNLRETIIKNEFVKIINFLKTKKRNMARNPIFVYFLNTTIDYPLLWL